MALMINLSPESERLLADEAARRSQGTEEFARAVLEEWLSHHSAGSAAAFLSTLCRPSREEVQMFLREQGAKPVERFEDLLADGPEDDGDEEFDVDQFLEARREWQWEGSPGFADPQARSVPGVPRR
jgi:hypothetical protein